MQRLGKAPTPAGRERVRNSDLPSKHSSKKEQVIFLSIASSVFFLVCVCVCVEVEEEGDEGFNEEGVRRMCEEYFLSLSPSSPSVSSCRACVCRHDGLQYQEGKLTVVAFVYLYEQFFHNHCLLAPFT